MTLGDIEFAGRDKERVTLTSEQLAPLESRFEGRVLRKGDKGWDDAVLVWNGMVAKTPALVLRPTSAAEVARAIAFAHEHNLLLSIKGGGHNIAGTSIADRGLMLDMSQMHDVSLDPQRKLAYVGPGCLLEDIDRATQEHGLATVLGFVSDTGVAGLTLGGGLGYLTRRFGWTADNLHRLEVVTADGTIRTADSDENADLFWALRGGGGNFGVVTRFTFRLHDVGPIVLGGLIAWPFERADEVISVYQRLTADAPRELAVWLIFLRAPAAPFVPTEWHGKRVCAMPVCYSGRLDRVEEVLAPIRRIDKPILNLLGERPYVQVQSYLTGTEPNGMHYYWKTEFLPELTDGFLSIMRDIFADCPIPEAELGVLHIEGALNERDEDDGAVGNRDARFVFGVNGMWEPEEPNAAMYRQWVRTAWERLRPFSTGGNYINFQTADEDEGRIQATYRSNFKRLVQIKNKYDRDNMFRVNRNIVPRI
jgi:hypothetical protein